MLVFIIPFLHLMEAQISEQPYSTQELVQVQHISQDNEIYKKYVKDLSISDYQQNHGQEEAEQNNQVVQALKQYSKEVADEAEQIVIENVNAESLPKDSYNIYQDEISYQDMVEKSLHYQATNEEDIEKQSNIMLQESITKQPLVEDDKNYTKYKALAKKSEVETNVEEELVVEKERKIQNKPKEEDKNQQIEQESNCNSEQVTVKEDQNYATTQSNYKEYKEEELNDKKSESFGKLVINDGGDGNKKDQKKDQTGKKENDDQNATPLAEVKETKDKENQDLRDEQCDDKKDKEPQEKPQETKKRDPLNEDDNSNTKYKEFAKQVAQQTEAKVEEQLVFDDEPSDAKKDKEPQEKPEETKKRDPLDEDDDKNTKYKEFVKQVAQQTEAKVEEQLVFDDEPSGAKKDKEPQEKPQETKKRDPLDEDDDKNTKYKALAKQAAEQAEAKVEEQLVLDDDEPKEPQIIKKRDPLVEDDEKNTKYKELAKQAAQEAEATAKEQIVTEDDIIDDMSPPMNSNDNANVTEIVPPEEECQVFVPELKKAEKKEEPKIEQQIIKPSSTKIEEAKQQEISWEPMCQEEPVKKPQEKPQEPQQPLVIILDNNTRKEKEIIKKLDESIIKGRGGLILDTGTYQSPYKKAKEGGITNQELKKGNELENKSLQDEGKQELNSTSIGDQNEVEKENEIEKENENENENQENVSQLQLALKNVLHHSRIERSYFTKD